MRIHVVKPGESIYLIAQQYRVSPQKIISDNELENPEQLVIGQTLVILEGNRSHRVASGETLYSISRDYKLTVDELLNANPQISNPSMIFVGQIITIPPKTINFGSIEVNGYAFPNIDMEVLRKTLPSLTYLSIFSYQVKPDGSLTTIQDTPLINAARNAGVAPLMVITNIKEGGSFDSDLAHTILTNTSVQNNLIANITKTLKDKSYYGLDIDFEYIYAYDRDNYNNFLRRITAVLRPLGYTVTTAVAPKISADQLGVLYQAHDYPIHGALVDHVIIMTYEWGFTYGPPMAVAPINQVRRVINYAVTAIPRNKIFMGIPNYGYDWTLPYKPGTAARALSNPGAVQLAYEVGANIQFDPVSQSPFFKYYDSSGRQHEVWFEDARSILAKLELANEYRLGGISYWTIGRYFPQNWLILNSVFKVKKV
ncbi:LysM peptidoglycan-binding domain-containing protein [Ruminiclostridium herbifermentans]|uniref:LysM peptidoglycan-binding domain-containing protein n=1 Tax=Ruminiclostridium herbifermentans TaxID=2488810 RepID=A0A4U7JGX1_9FIRM|nr:LysM peptidoglycan-binding domain-containing protein [Ruminiclostridium herbifermentans]QNU67347.1 LysM peptidoglycan-binding domain-containing protein [Ruminiclostridium herbifermentans]